ncbi:MAG: hypothetical protein L0271_21440 [Gemmatimonadetes bacterium]|nr:hypothetical protein [Gemmatimonadota bacterium]
MRSSGERAPWLRIMLLFLTAAAAVIAAAGTWWSMQRRISELSTELADARATLQSATASLQLLWTTTTKLDETQDSRQERLADSLTAVRTFAETESRLWETAYGEHESVLQTQAQRLALLERNSAAVVRLTDASLRTNTKLDALMNRSAMIEADVRTVGAALATLRQTLALLTDEFASLERRFTAMSDRIVQQESQLVSSRSDQSRIGVRLDDVESWVSPFRAAGLDAGSLRSRLAALAADLRTITMRVDSLRRPADR